MKPDAKDFLGKDKILAGKKAGLSNKLVGFKMVDRGIPRHGYKVVLEDGSPLGLVTSGTMSPTLSENIGIAYLPKENSAVGSEIWVDIRGRAAKATVVETPFVKV